MDLRTFNNLDKKKQNRIFRAALREFSERGYAGASINRIVADLGIAKGSIFQYFGDKQGLFEFVFLKAVEIVKDHLKKVRDETTDLNFFTRIEILLVSGIAFLRKNSRIYSLYTKILYEGNLKFCSDLFTSIRRESFDFLSEMIRLAVSRGEVRSDLDIACATFYLDSLFDRFLQAYMLEHFGSHPGLYKAKDEDINTWVKGLVSLLRKGMEKGN